eukprot:GSChrysophyteH2.ASY1.ANO1.730.1 assembled CDS
MVKCGLHKWRQPGEPRGGRGKPCRLTINRKSHYMQRWFVYNPWLRPFIVFSFAASKIQKIIRGHLVRKAGELKDYVMQRYNRKMAKIQAEREAKATRGQPQLDKYLAFMDTLRQAEGHTRLGKAVMKAPKWVDGGYSAWCTVRIQAWYRAQVARRHFYLKKNVITQIASLVIQSAFRNHKYYQRQQIAEFEALEKKKRIKVKTPVHASVCIQLAWRSHCNRRIYSYYRDLVVDKLQGAPQDLLRTIIPNEAMLLDRAAGVRVRFRLGGAVFPPKVYFKIFTYRGVCDVNAFAPRDYAKELPQEAFQANIKSQFIPKDQMKYNRNIRVGGTYFDTKVSSATSTDTWYKREEKNPWRPLASQLFDDVLTPPWMKDGVVEKAPEPFHFSQLKRKTDQVRARKLKKREWLRKAYMLAGCGTAAGEDDQQQQQQQGNTSNSLAPASHGGRNGGGDETEDLLNWSMALDYDDYASGWAQIGTSAPSDSDKVYT